jgi:hypothetical protein
VLTPSITFKLVMRSFLFDFATKVFAGLDKATAPQSPQKIQLWIHAL